VVAQVLAGEKSAFGPLIDRHRPGAIRLAWRLLSDPADAKDGEEGSSPEVPEKEFLMSITQKSMRNHRPMASWRARSTAPGDRSER
jgi:hypothetical protein